MRECVVCGCRVDCCDGVDRGNSTLRGAAESDARGKQGAGGVLAGVDWGAVENYFAAVAGLRSELEVVGDGD